MQAEIQLSPLNSATTWHLGENRLAGLKAALHRGHSTQIEDNEPQRAQAAQQLASLFIFQLLQEMRKTIPKSGLFDGGREQEMYEQMTDERLADLIAANGQFGIASTIRQELRKYG